MNTENEVEAIKDVDAAHPIASAWRPVLREIIASFVRGDYSLSRGVKHVTPPSAKVALHVEKTISDYGEQLAELPEEVWRTSVAQWMGTHWDVLVDLWSESGACDLVLAARVKETAEGFRVEIDSVLVP